MIKRKILMFFSFSLAIIAALFFWFTQMQYQKNLMIQRTGTIIILNGSSACGKTSIQKKIQDLADVLYLKVGIDTFFDALIPEPDLNEFHRTQKIMQYTKEGEFIRGITIVRDDNGNQIIPLQIGSAGQRVIKGMHKAIAAYAHMGNNVVVDYILYDQAWLNDLIACFSHFNTYLIGVACPLNVLEEREKARATSPAGHARSHYRTVHDNCVYDLEVDTSVLTPEQCAQRIVDFVTMYKPTALEKLKRSFCVD